MSFIACFVFVSNYPIFLSTKTKPGKTEMLYQKVLYKTILYTKHYLKILVFMLLIEVLSINEETEVDRLKIIWYLLLEFGKPSLGLTVLTPVCFCFFI